MKSEFKMVDVTFYEVKLTESDLDRLSENQKALYALFSYCFSEINAIGRMYISTWHEIKCAGAIEAALVVQKHTILRIWSAKIVEAFKLIDTLPKRYGKDDDAYHKFRRIALDKIAPLKNTNGSKVAYQLRNKATNHYSMTDAKEALAHASYTDNASMYLHENDGNCVYFYGENVIFMKRLEVIAKRLELSSTDPCEVIDCWLGWCVDAKNALADLQRDLVSKSILDPLNLMAEETKYSVESQLMAKRGEVLVPLLIEEDQNQ